MKEIVNKIFENAKSAYKESVLIENKIMEDKLLTLLADIRYLQNDIENNKYIKKKKKKIDEEKVNNEIKKVKRKVPLWLEKTNQLNYKILKTFMNLSNNNSHYVNITTLESHSKIQDPKKFLANYNLLKTISEKNHAKVFEEKNGQVTLWAPVSEIVESYFK